MLTAQVETYGKQRRWFIRSEDGTETAAMQIGMTPQGTACTHRAQATDGTIYQITRERNDHSGTWPVSATFAPGHFEAELAEFFA